VTHHHHSVTPAAVAGILGLLAAGAAYAVGRAQTTQLVGGLHTDMHEQISKLDTQDTQLRVAVGREFSGMAAGIQNIADVVNNQNERFEETLARVFPNRAEPGGHEPGADE